MTRALFLGVLISFSLGSCTQRLICPAYQSAFIYDKPTQKEKFVYYNDNPSASKDILASNSKTITLPARDSAWDKSTVLPGPALPQVRRVKKDRYLLLPDKTYKQAMKSLMTVEMKQVLPKKTDSLDVKAALDSAAMSVTDTLTAQAGKPKAQAEDSVYAITKTKEKYNLDQDIYMWYFRDVLVLPDVRAAKMEQKETSKSNAKVKSKKEGGFFKNLFGKKEKPKAEKKEKVKSDTTLVDPPKQKKSLNPFKKKASAAETEKKKPDATKKEEDDGF